MGARTRTVSFLAALTALMAVMAALTVRAVAAAPPPNKTQPPPPVDAAPSPPPDAAPTPISGRAATVAAESPPPAPAEPPPAAEEEPAGPVYAPAPPPYEPPLIRRYGDRGMSEVSIGLGYSSAAGFLGAGGFRYFVTDGLAPGVEGTYVAGGRGVSSYGLALGSLRFVPLRTAAMALVLTGRAGRVFLSDHADGWGAGAGASAILSMGGGAGLELGYQFLRLLPSSFCSDLSSCVLHGPVLGLRVTF